MTTLAPISMASRSKGKQAAAWLAEQIGDVGFTEAAARFGITDTSVRQAWEMLGFCETPRELARACCLKPLTASARALVIGSLLGDACLVWPVDTFSPLLMFNHGRKQEDYCRHKATILADYVRTPPKIVKHPNGWSSESCRFQTVTSPVFEEFEAMCIRRINGKRVKTITEKWITAITWEAVAFWFMDDGSVSKTKAQATFATHGFQPDQVKQLAAMLASMGVEAIAEPVKGNGRIYWQIRLRAEPARLLISKIAPYVPQCMDYKLKVRPAREPRNCVVCGIEIGGERRMHSDLVSCRKPACRKEHKRRTNARWYRKQAKAVCKPSVMSTLNVVAQVLHEVAPRALRAKQIVDLSAGRLHTKSKTPHAVISRDLACDIRDHGEASRFVRIERGAFALKEFHSLRKVGDCA